MKLHVVSKGRGRQAEPVAVCGHRGDFAVTKWDKYQDEYYDPVTFEFIDRELVCETCHDILHRIHGHSKRKRPSLRPVAA